MNIAVIAPTEIPARRANTVQVMKMTQAFMNNNHHARVVSPLSSASGVRERGSYHPRRDYQPQELAQHYGLEKHITVEWLPARPNLRRYDYSLASVHWARKWGADLIYTRLPGAAALASSLGLKTILEVHDLPQGVMGTRLFRRFLRGSGARRLVVITLALADDLKNTFNIPGQNGQKDSLNNRSILRADFTLIAPDGVDLTRYTNIPTATQARRNLIENFRHKSSQRSKKAAEILSADRFTAGYTGHLYAGRGTHMLLSLAERLPGISFLLVGGEPQEVNQLQDHIEQLNLSNIVVTGFVPNAELPQYQAACEVLLMPYQRRVAASSGGDISRYLSPMKLFEYLACGRAILSSNLAVLHEVLNKKNSVLLPPDDVEAWAHTLQALQDNPKKRERLGLQASIDAKQYTWDARAARILDGIE